MTNNSLPNAGPDFQPDCEHAKWLLPPPTLPAKIIKERVTRRVLAQVGGYRGAPIDQIIATISALDEHGISWVLHANREELRSVLFPIDPARRVDLDAVK